ncbi:MAG: tetratricopeptide repeat protein [Candidatus Nitrosotenuis sp.]
MAYVGNPIDVIKKLHSDKQWDDIVSFCQKMLDADAKDLVALQNMATALLNLGKLEESMSCCDRVFELNESDEYALKNKIFALERLGRHVEIIPHCDKLLSKNSSHTWALNSKALALNDLGKHDDAIYYYDQALKIEPNNITALLNKAITLSFLQKYDQAIQFYDDVQKQEKLSEAASAKSEAYKKIGKEDEAFLAAQGLLISDITKYVSEAKAKKMRVFDYYCMMEYEDLKKREMQYR